MKRLLILTATAALLLPTLSLAQPGRPDNNRPGDNRPGRPDRPNPGGPNRPGGPSTKPGPLPGPNRPGITKPVPLPGPNRPGPGMRPPPRPPIVRPPPRPPQFSWRGRYYAQRPGPLFRYPPGYAYRRWAIGAFLPTLFLGSTYFYDDWRGLNIDRPPPGRRWVRYGPDLLLVNTRTRRVEDVIYGVFY